MINLLQYYIGIIVMASGAFYAGYQRGSRTQTIKDTLAKRALVKIVEKLGEQQVSGLGREIRDIALNGLR